MLEGPESRNVKEVAEKCRGRDSGEGTGDTEAQRDNDLTEKERNRIGTDTGEDGNKRQKHMHTGNGELTGRPQLL